MQLTNQTIDVSRIEYSLIWLNTPSNDNWEAKLTVPIPVGSEGTNFLDNADDFAVAWQADVLTGATYTSFTLKRVILGTGGTGETQIAP